MKHFYHDEKWQCSTYQFKKGLISTENLFKQLRYFCKAEMSDQSPRNSVVQMRSILLPHSHQTNHFSCLILSKQINSTNNSRATIKRFLNGSQWQDCPYKAFAQLIPGKLENLRMVKSSKAIKVFIRMQVSILCFIF